MSRVTTARPVGVTLLALFFGLGTSMCLLTMFLLLVPGSPLATLWRLNPQARDAFTALGGWALLLMAGVGIACGAAAFGLFAGARWGRGMAVGILAVNLAGDAANVLLRHDPRALIGLPIGGLFIWYLHSPGRADYFAADSDAGNELRRGSLENGPG